MTVLFLYISKRVSSSFPVSAVHDFLRGHFEFFSRNLLVLKTYVCPYKKNCIKSLVPLAAWGRGVKACSGLSS